MSLNQNNLYEFGRFRIDLFERTLWQNGELIPLPPKVMETLCLLVENRGRLMTKEELMSCLWSDTFVEERNLTQHIFTLRKVLGKQLIETLPRRGYRFTAAVRPVEIQQQEAIHVSHNKQTRISAEGFVSTEELTEAVKKVAKSLLVDKDPENAEPKQIETRKSGFFPIPLSYVALTMIVLPLIVFGAAFWAWQNEYLSFRKTFIAKL